MLYKIHKWVAQKWGTQVCDPDWKFCIDLLFDLRKPPLQNQLWRRLNNQSLKVCERESVNLKLWQAQLRKKLKQKGINLLECLDVTSWTASNQECVLHQRLTLITPLSTHQIPSGLINYLMKDRDTRRISRTAYSTVHTSSTPYDSYGMSISDEGLKCLNTLEIWFLASMVVTMIVSLIALFRAWNHRHDFKKVILSRYKWFGIDHSGSSNTKHAHIPRQSPEFAQPCECFNELG